MPPAIGPTLSGYITEYLNWRLIFFINVPIGVVVLFLAAAAMREMEHYTEQKFDLSLQQPVFPLCCTESEMRRTKAGPIRKLWRLSVSEPSVCSFSSSLNGTRKSRC
ncbi:MFS transporter [Thermoactinomyces sp. CICC 10521]|uniref:MFS transporter n=1 Tax=Thermoactinomyces sp. CICC 10521 TaxID=2767426 RepID=UPI00351C9A34